jgi:archaellum component FlaC
MATINPEVVQLREKLEELEKRVTTVEKASDWRRQFFAVALPIMLSIFISVGIAVYAQTSRFESIEARLTTVERDLKQVQIEQAAMRKDIEYVKKDIEQLKTDVAEIKRDLKTLLSRSR